MSAIGVTPRVLIVEDNSIEARILACVIEHLGMHPVVVNNAAEALTICSLDRPSLAILDIKLPGGIDGIELAKKLGNLPLLFISSDDDELTFERAQEVRPLAFLGKPYEVNQLQQIIRQGLELSNMLASLPSMEWLFVREHTVLVRIHVADIACVQMTQQHAVLMLVNGRRHSLRMTLAEVLICLPDRLFVQCHRSWAVSLQHIQQVDTTDDIVYLASGIQAALGRVHRQRLLQRLHILS